MTSIISSLGLGTPGQVVDEIFFFKSRVLKTGLFHVGPSAMIVFFHKVSQGADEYVELSIWRQ